MGGDGSGRNCAWNCGDSRVAIGCKTLAFLGWRIRFALVLGELQLELLHRSANAFQHFERNSELAIARSAHRDGRCSSQPLGYAQIAFRHGGSYLSYRIVSSISEIQSGR